MLLTKLNIMRQGCGALLGEAKCMCVRLNVPSEGLLPEEFEEAELNMLDEAT